MLRGKYFYLNIICLAIIFSIVSVDSAQAFFCFKSRKQVAELQKELAAKEEAWRNNTAKIEEEKEDLKKQIMQIKEEQNELVLKFNALGKTLNENEDLKNKVKKFEAENSLLQEKLKKNVSEKEELQVKYEKLLAEKEMIIDTEDVMQETVGDVSVSESDEDTDVIIESDIVPVEK